MNKLMSLFIALFVFVVSCEEDKSPTTQSDKTGNITGNLIVSGANDNSEAYVSLKGTSYVTTTNSNGQWTLKDVESGVYDIIFSKPGYDTTEVYGFQFAGNGTAYCNFNEYKWATHLENYPGMNWAIFAHNNTIIQNIETPITDKLDTDNVKIKFLSIRGKLSQDDNLLFFFGKDKNVSNLNYLNMITNSWSYSYNNQDNSFIFDIEIRQLEYMNYVRGDKIYVIVFPGQEIIETDLRNGQIRRCGLGMPSNVAEFIVP